jgi:hypothetical protein
MINLENYLKFSIAVGAIFMTVSFAEAAFPSVDERERISQNLSEENKEHLSRFNEFAAVMPDSKLYDLPEGHSPVDHVNHMVLSMIAVSSTERAYDHNQAVLNRRHAQKIYAEKKPRSAEAFYFDIATQALPVFKFKDGKFEGFVGLGGYSFLAKSYMTLKEGGTSVGEKIKRHIENSFDFALLGSTSLNFEDFDRPAARYVSPAELARSLMHKSSDLMDDIYSSALTVLQQHFSSVQSAFPGGIHIYPLAHFLPQDPDFNYTKTVIEMARSLGFNGPVDVSRLLDKRSVLPQTDFSWAFLERHFSEKSLSKQAVLALAPFVNARGLSDWGKASDIDPLAQTARIIGVMTQMLISGATKQQGPDFREILDVSLYYRTLGLAEEEGFVKKLIDQSVAPDVLERGPLLYQETLLTSRVSEIVLQKLAAYTLKSEEALDETEDHASVVAIDVGNDKDRYFRNASLQLDFLLSGGRLE